MKITWTEVNIDGVNGSATAELPNGKLFAACGNSSIVSFGFTQDGQKKESAAILNLGWVGEKNGKSWPSAVDILSEAMQNAERFFMAEIFLLDLTAPAQ